MICGHGKMLSFLENLLASAASDKTVCSYACGGSITEKSKEGYLHSPGFISKMNYPPYVDCTWKIYGKTLHADQLDHDHQTVALVAIHTIIFRFQKKDYSNDS